VQGAAQVRSVGLAVDACMATFRLAAQRGCEMLITHHGIIWGGLTSVTGRVHEQIRFLIENDISLYAAHLPLDLHPEYGNNAQLAKLLGLSRVMPFGVYKGVTIGFEGVARRGTTRDGLVEKLCSSLDTACTVLPFGTERIGRVAVISGGGAGELAEAIEKGIDCYITGESSHENYHAALEAGINVIYAGHYHTETVGVKALGSLIEKKFGIETLFLDVPTAI
jgi:dinuclear metal center YbgI/SA1388 family protein